VQWKRGQPRAIASAAILASIALAAAGCSSSKAKAPTRLVSDEPRFTRDVDPTDLFPEDLDLVVRIDVARMRAGLGPGAAKDLAARALAEAGGEEEVKSALACAEVVWIAARLGDLDAGDHVAVFEGRDCVRELSGSRWEKVRSHNGKLAIFDRRGEPPRAGTARIINMNNRAVAFVSPAELDAVKRVLVNGPDPARGLPTAEGLVSVDLRAGRLPRPIERRFPSLGAIAAGVERLRVNAALVEGGLRVEGELVGKTREGAEKASRFLAALRDAAKEGRYGEVIGAMAIEPVDRTVRLKWVVPSKVVLALLAPGDGSGGK
jgi:hypothetical protein